MKDSRFKVKDPGKVQGSRHEEKKGFII